MKRDTGIHGKGLEPLAEQFGIHLPDLVGGERDLPDEERPPRNIDGDARQRTIHRQVGVGVAGDALFAHRAPV